MKCKKTKRQRSNIKGFKRNVLTALQESHEKVKRMVTSSGFRALNRYSHEVSIRKKKLNGHFYEFLNPVLHLFVITTWIKQILSLVQGTIM